MSQSRHRADVDT